MVASAQGVDVSNFQGKYDWAAAKKRMPGLQFGLYRMTEALGKDVNSPDPDARHNHDGVKALGIHHGAYHVLHPGFDGAAQARYFIDQHEKIGLSVTDMLWLDDEIQGSSPGHVAETGQAFMAELHKLAPHNPIGVYSYISFIKAGNCAGLGHWPLWLAYPSSRAPVPPMTWARWTFWQWGLRNGVDADAFNGTAGELDAWVASFAPRKGPTRHIATGLESLADIGIKHKVSLHDLVWLLARERPEGGVEQRHYINGGDLTANMPLGMIYYLP